MVESALTGERAALPPPGPPSRQMGRPSGPIRAARQKKVGGHPPKSGGPNEGRPGAGPAARRAARSFGAGCHHGRRAAHRATTLKVRAALTEKGPPLGPPFEKGAARRGKGGPHEGRQDKAGSGQVAARRAARAGSKGGQGRARGRPTGPPSRPDHSVKCAGSSKTGSGDQFLPNFFGVCVKDALFLPPRGPPPPPARKSHHLPDTGSYELRRPLFLQKAKDFCTEPEPATTARRARSSRSSGCVARGRRI